MITITQDEFKEEIGIDLNLELQGLDDEGNKVNRFLRNCAREINDRIQIVDEKGLSNHQIEYIKLAIIYYGAYIIQNGDISMQSGINDDKGAFISKQQLDNVELPMKCVQFLKKAGFYRSNVSGYNYRKVGNINEEY